MTAPALRIVVVKFGPPKSPAESNENERKTEAILAPPFCFQPSHDLLNVAPPNQHDMVVTERIPELDARDRVEIPLSPCRAPLGMIMRAERIQ